MTRAVVCRELGNGEAVRVEDVASPTPDNEQVHIAVCAAGVSFANILVLAGKHQNKPEVPFTPGTEVSGVVLACGGNVTRFKPGDRVTAGIRRGGYSEQVLAPQSTVYPIPAGVDHDTAVQIPTSYGTAYGALKWRARLAAGETVLVHGAAGGSGMAAIEIARCLGARVIAVAGSEEKIEMALRLGASVVVNHARESFREVVLRETGGRGADVIYDPVGGDVFSESMRCIAPEGRIIPIGFASGTIPSAPANIVLVKNFDVLGIYWGYYMGWGRMQPPPGTQGRVREAVAEVLSWCAVGRMQARTFKSFRLDDFRAALDTLSSREVMGRVVLQPLTEEQAQAMVQR